MLQRREGALLAVVARTQPAGQADGDDRLAVVEIDAVRVDELARVADLAAEAHGEDRVRGVVAAAALAERARDPEVGRAVGHLRDLRAEHAGGQEGGEDVPARTGAGEA